MIFIDASVWIDYFNGVITPETDYLDRIVEQDIILVSDLTLVEVLQGFRSEADFEAARQALLLFQPIEILNTRLAIRSARNYRFLRQQGVTVRKTIDCLIATYCIEADVPLLHADRDFEPFETYLGLTVLHV
jgi:hypothetical protein